MLISPEVAVFIVFMAIVIKLTRIQDTKGKKQ